jgi:hypothetical protein
MNNPLLQYAKNVHSQTGEDGVLEHILKTIGVNKDWCVEFGAWDGKHHSNTHKLMQEGWSGVFIEGSKERHKDLEQTYQGNNKAHCICAFVNFEGENNLDGILRKTPITKDFAVLSIDIDGNDYHIWNSLKEYVPQVIIIEFNPAIPPHVEYIQPKDMSVNQGNGIASLVKLGKEKGYELVAMTSLNAFFVTKEHFSKFAIQDNRPETMFTDKSWLMDVFQLYDGTLMFTGKQKMLWHGVTIKKSFQPIPKVFRVFPSVMGPIRLFFLKLWRKVQESL